MTSNDSGSKPVNENSEKSFIKTAQETLGQAVDATVEAVRERPVTAAAIVGGVAAAAVGARYGINKLRTNGDDPAGSAE